MNNEQIRYRKEKISILVLLATTLLLIFPLTASALGQENTLDATENINVITDLELAVQLDIIRGEGQGVTEEYLAKKTTRIQAAIMLLRLKGLEEEALAYKGEEQFADAHLTGPSFQKILSYLKAHPELGWIGSGNNNFDPFGLITSQQYYKVMLEALEYRQNIDFKYNDTIDFASSVGLQNISHVTEFHNIHIAVATIETLQSNINGVNQTLSERLVSQGMLDQNKITPLNFPRVGIMTHNEIEGGFLTDAEGHSIYYFTKDVDNLNACQDNCINNWPIYYNEKIRLDSRLNTSDFDSFLREDGEMQTTYKGWPLYYFAADEQPGDIKGEGLGSVWFLAQPTKLETISVESKPVEASVTEHVIEISDFAFNITELTIQAGDSVTFINNDHIQHNAVAVDGSFSTPLLNKGVSHTVVFNEAGEYDYYCAPHREHMKGKIIVKKS